MAAAAAAGAGGSSDRAAAARARGKGGDGGGRSAYQRQMKGDRSSRGARAKQGGILQTAGRARMREEGESFDSGWGYDHLQEGEEQVGYLVNMLASTVAGDDRIERSGIDLYFLKQDGGTFKATVLHEPYFYVACKREWARVVASLLQRKFEGVLSGVDSVEMEDLDLSNHLSGIKALYLRLRFRSVGELMDVRREVRSAVERNRAREASDAGFEEQEVRPGTAPLAGADRACVVTLPGPDRQGSRGCRPESLCARLAPRGWRHHQNSGRPASRLRSQPPSPLSRFATAGRRHPR